MLRHLRLFPLALLLAVAGCDSGSDPDAGLTLGGTYTGTLSSGNVFTATIPADTPSDPSLPFRVPMTNGGARLSGVGTYDHPGLFIGFDESEDDVSLACTVGGGGDTLTCAFSTSPSDRFTLTR